MFVIILLSERMVTDNESTILEFLKGNLSLSQFLIDQRSEELHNSNCEGEESQQQESCIPFDMEVFIDMVAMFMEY